MRAYQQAHDVQAVSQVGQALQVPIIVMELTQVQAQQRALAGQLLQHGAVVWRGVGWGGVGWGGVGCSVVARCGEWCSAVVWCSGVVSSAYMVLT